MRGLRKDFFDALKVGMLKPLLEYVKNDNTLDLEIRENYVNIYYRGGNILDVKIKKGLFSFHFKDKYLANHPFLLYGTIEKQYKSMNWNEYFPVAKQAMDYYFTKIAKQEREFQQLVVRENNNSKIANGTDYFIIDIEYDNHSKARFDIIAVEWPTKSRKLSKNNLPPKLVIFEMKYGDKAFTHFAGIQKHINDFKTFQSKSNEVIALKNEMLVVFQQKRDLGLIPCLSGIGKTNAHSVKIFTNDIELIFLFVNHDPESTILKDELSYIHDQGIKFITANFLGYGLYLENVFTYKKFIHRFKQQISNAH